MFNQPRKWSHVSTRPFFSILAMLSLLVACSSSSDSDSENQQMQENNKPTNIKIGVLPDLTGPTSSLSEPMALSAELAIAEVSDLDTFLSGTSVIVL